MDKPLVSIIIPTYNRGHLINETLESIIKQTYKNWECIVVDDGSNDHTEKILNSYKSTDDRIKFYNRPSNLLKGANACRNFGFSISKGEFINWFDSDDLMTNDKLELQVHRLLKSKLNFIVCQTLVFENSIDNILGLRKNKIYSTNFFNDFITNDIKWLTQAPMIRRSLIIDNKLKFDNTLSQSQERDFFVNLLNCTDDYLYDEKPLVLFRKHKNSISHSDKYSSAKIDSNFRVNFNVLKRYENKLSNKSKLYLKKMLISNLNISARNKDFKLVNKFNSFLKDKVVNLSFVEKYKIKLGLITLKYFEKGDVLFKFKKLNA